MDKSCVLGIDIGGTRIRFGVVDRGGAVLYQKTAFIAQYDPTHFVDGLCQSMDEVCGALPEECRLKAITVGVPSTLSRDRKVVLSTPNIPALNNIALGEILENRFHLPVFVERDVNFLLYYDCRDLKIPSEGIVMACYLGTGIGNAVSIGGELLIGRNGAACELGHIPVYLQKERCVCGNVGCIETIASGKYLAALTEADYPGEDISFVFEKHGSDKQIEAFIEALSLPVATEINLLDPDYVIIGGGIPAMQGFPKALFEEKMMEHVRKPYPAENLRLIYARECPLAGPLGGAAYAFDRL